MQLGDQIQVEIGANGQAVTIVGGGGSVTASGMKVLGTIVEDLGSHWRVKLMVSFFGKNMVDVAK